jgi:hypothetical protein
MLYPGRMIQHIYHAWCQCFILMRGPYWEIHITTLYEPLGLCLAGESVEELDWI